MTRRILGLAAVALTLFVAPSQAESPQWVIEATPNGREPFNADAELAYQVGLDYWGGPDPRCTELNRFLAPVVMSGKSIVAGVGNKPVEAEPCTVIVKQGMPFAELCYVVVHEVGHNHGLGDSEDPTNIMFSGATTATVPGCDAIIIERERAAQASEEENEAEREAEYQQQSRQYDAWVWYRQKLEEREEHRQGCSRMRRQGAKRWRVRACFRHALRVHVPAPAKKPPGFIP